LETVPQHSRPSLWIASITLAERCATGDWDAGSKVDVVLSVQHYQRHVLHPEARSQVIGAL